ncbi:MAG TPA: hypothetical protein VJZ49_03885 [Syntrophales bacterium]|nr:hypothetical protein [Syntrophales bacterium]
METLDLCIEKLRDYVKKKRKDGRQIREMVCPETIEELLAGLPVRVGEAAGPRIILKEDTFVELGNPSIGGCSFVLWTNDLSLVNGGQITLIGPGIQEAGGKSLAFGQVILLAGEMLREEDHLQLEKAQYMILGEIEGYMIRSVPRCMWTRVSNKAGGKGFSFEDLGRALMAILRSKLASVEAMEVLFVTSSKEDIESLESIAVEVEKVSNWFRKLKRNEHGLYECNTDDCNDCEEKAVCDTVREVRVMRKQKAF